MAYKVFVDGHEGTTGLRIPISSSAVLKRMQQDEQYQETYQRLLEHVKYEQQVTDFAVQLHHRQYQAMLRMQKMQMQVPGCASRDARSGMRVLGGH